MASHCFKRLAVLTAALLIGAVGSASAAIKTEQTIELGNSSNPYPFVVFANANLQQPSRSIERAVVITHGIKRNADDYYATGLTLLSHAQVAPGGTLLLAPNFLAKSDALASSDLPLWHKGSWIQGDASTLGHSGVTSFQALDDIVGYLSDRKRFPALKEIVLIGHSAGAQLMQRYAVFNNQDTALQQAGIAMRYVISSPSSYVYFDPSRPQGQGQGFAPVSSAACADYNQYRYGLDQPPAYVKAQNLTAQQLFKRYASRNVTYLVGADDTDPNHRVLDKSCGAEEQGDSRVARQLNYVGYEQFLAQKWQVAIHHPQFEVPGVAHDANGIYGSQIAAQRLFPTH